MTFAIAYWVLMLLWLIFGTYWNWNANNFAPVGGHLLIFILLVLLGWKTFGPPIHQ